MTQEEFIELMAEYHRIKKEKETNVKIEIEIKF